MRRKFLLLNLILVLIVVVGCTSGSNPDPNNEPDELNKPDKPEKPSKPDKPDDKDTTEKLNISSYYPIKKDTRYVYEGTGNEFTSYNVYTEYTHENKVQHRVNNGETEVIEIIEVKDGEIVKLLSRPESYYRENLLTKKDSDTKDKKSREILLKKPIKQGNSWELDDDRKRTITNTSSDVATPMGEYKAIEVTTESKDGTKTLDYYVKDIGLVKSVFVSEGMEVTSELKDVENDAKLIQKIKFFYPNIDDERLYYVEEDVEFKTNDISRNILEKKYKDVLKGTQATVLTKNTKINYLYLNDDGMVYIDLNDAFVKEMNAGSGYESKILESMSATFGNYYNVDKVMLTIDGGDYESGHIILQEGDYLQFDIKDAVNK